MKESTSTASISCPMCGQEMRAITAQHIRKHGHTTESFKTLWNLTYLKCEDMRAAQSQFMHRNNPTVHGHRPESIELMRQNRRGKGVGVTGKYERTDDVRHRISEGVSRAYREGRCRWKGVHIETDKGPPRVWVRSSWEERVARVLDLHPCVEAFVYEPVSLPYVFHGTTKHYTPDFQVELEGGIVEIWEVKPQQLTDDPRNLAKRDALNEWCHERGFNARTVTLSDIEGMERQVGLREWTGPGSPWVRLEDPDFRPTSPETQKGLPTSSEDTP